MKWLAGKGRRKREDGKEVPEKGLWPQPNAGRTRWLRAYPNTIDNPWQIEWFACAVIVSALP
jgi:hypothetical protein